jgi:hypothetical protein
LNSTIWQISARECFETAYKDGRVLPIGEYRKTGILVNRIRRQNAPDYVESWRRTHRSRSGVSRTAAVLGLDYYGLKKRAEGAASEAQASGPAFVELPTPVLAGKQCLFELDNGTGATMRVQLTGYDAADVEALARGFWSAS